jgi:hypothetical protein
MLRKPLPLLLALALTPQLALSKDQAGYQNWVGEMKEAPRGPFERLRWFCNDGTMHPPKSYACQKHGGGYQHGEWSERTVELRDQGYKIANLFAGMDAKQFAAGPGFNDSYGQILVERYLIGADDGWILRRALFYRGAIQEEDEREGARALLEHLASQADWIGARYPALRIGVQLLPHGKENASAQKVRRESAALSDKDAGFKSLRAKIHGAPDASDAQRVRDYAAGVGDSALKARYEALARLIDDVYQGEPLTLALEEKAAKFSGAPWLQKMLREAAAGLQADGSAGNRYRVTARLLADLRDSMGRIRAASARLSVLDLSLTVEGENFRASAELRDALGGMTRSQRLGLIGAAIDAAYGTGLVKGREREALHQSLSALSGPEVQLGRYLEELRYLGRVPSWATQNLRFFFFEAMQKLAEIEPKAILFIQDQLRGSVLLFYSKILDGLSQDGNRAAGVRHKVFGEEIGIGFHALNPGIAVGTLHARPHLERMEEFDPKGIYLLPETVSDLPPIAGILTAGEGNPLSHVQLLARNLGIPNVSVNESLTPRLAAHDGEKIVIAVSPTGLVEMAAFDERWEKVLGEAGTGGDVVIRPDMQKLDLSANDFISLDDLRAADSGRTVGPKAAKLGELRKAFPDSVAPGVAIPFGIFKSEVLDKPYKQGPRSIFDWMVEQYRALDAMPAGSAERNEKTEAFRAELYELILAAKPGPAFRDRLRAAMASTFGTVDTGVFVRSDTNVEDLPGFTGAGLNLTLPNVVGFDNLISAISRVWASPFTARAFAWRQSHMQSPEHVYTSILLLKSVASDKSGVLVTQDLDTGDHEVLSVAINEGVGGAVDGQAAESLRIDTRDGAVRVMGTATAPWRRRPAATGGIEKLPATGADTVLQPAEIKRLIAFARDELPVRFPPITDDAGRPAAADVEFGFVDGQLRLFQIRPFLESRSARGNVYLIEMDKALTTSMDNTLNLNEVPGQ